MFGLSKIGVVARLSTETVFQEKTRLIVVLKAGIHWLLYRKSPEVQSKV
jgi:hypothetical protein